MGSNSTPKWDRRAKVAGLLTRGTNQKLAGAGLASEPLQRAYELARGEVPLHAPWPALTAYRLAHALLPGANTAAELEVLESLFDEASAFGHLGPWPPLYRLAAMQRLGRPRAALDDTFGRAAQAYRSWAQARMDPELGAAPVGTARSDLFNLVDLAGFFVGADASSLAGRGLRHDFDGAAGPQLVLVPGAAPTSLAEPLAEVELAELRSMTPGALTFRLPATGEPTWCGADGSVEVGGAGEMRLLVSLLSGDAATVEALAERATGTVEASSLSTLRQLRRRLRTRLNGAGIQVSGEDLKARDERGRFRLPGGWPLLGIASTRRYREPV